MALSTAATYVLLLFTAIGFLVSGTVQAQDDQPVPSESECRPYIEKALKQLGTSDAPPETSEEDSGEQPGGAELATSDEQGDQSSIDETSAEAEAASAEDAKTSAEDTTASDEEASSEEGEQASAEGTPGDAQTLPDDGTNAESQEDTTEERSAEEIEAGRAPGGDEDSASTEEASGESAEESREEIREKRSTEEAYAEEEGGSSEEGATGEEASAEKTTNAEESSATEGASAEAEVSAEESAAAKDEESSEGGSTEEESSEEDSAAVEGGANAAEGASKEDSTATTEDIRTEETGTSHESEGVSSAEKGAESDEDASKSGEDAVSSEEGEITSVEEGVPSAEGTPTGAEEAASSEGDSKEDASTSKDADESAEEGGAAGDAPSAEDSASVEDATGGSSSEERDATTVEERQRSAEGKVAASDEEKGGVSDEEPSTEEQQASAKQSGETPAAESDESKSSEETATESTAGESAEASAEASNESDETSAEGEAPAPADSIPEEEELTLEVEIPENLRPRDHVAQILRLDSESLEKELILSKTADITLKELKRLYDNAIKPLEMLYKYRELSNRHFGDPEIFSKPLILFMGPWSGGKSTIINYLLDNEYTSTALRTGAEPSPAYFNILMWGDQVEVLDGTQLAADWTFSGLQKFGQGMLDRLRGLRLPNPLLEKVNIVEIPGILEIRKQVERLFPFNDACQWFIDRADIIFLVYDPSKLDVGPETEAILDQLKGREYQTRIILNKADQVRPEELMRVQGTLIWNISPLMSSSEPPVMYSTSLWSLPYESGAPTRLLHAQERAFLRDLRDAIDKRVENKIASARRFAVRVRNHAKMVDCYLTTYYNHKSFFANKKKISDDIIEHPQDYHIYEGLSTLTNISRYDLPDPDVYKDFFRLNPLYDFQLLSSTCTYFRGCPINRLDIAIAYDLPELVGKYKKSVEAALAGIQPKS
ncbi:sarcalumenin isoform X2 [Cryptotermes secundus]|uniref:sarcalumenin isoform X2 n=1 Tax=Cryptotermes secundus TaxID=105785 RepID=UPI000CD7BBF5|nr:sarcalumenin isoform X2 [Cryptotermes secundus]